MAHVLLKGSRIPVYSSEALCRSALLLLAAAYAFPAVRLRQWRDRFAVVFVLSALVCAIAGLLQWMGLLEGAFPSTSNPQRMYSFFGNNHLLAGYIAAALPLSVRWSRLGSWRGTAAACCSALFVFAIALAGVRTAWLLAPVGLGWGILSGRKAWGREAVRLLAVALLSAALAFSLRPAFLLDRLNSALEGTSEGISVRLWLWDGTVRMASAHPWIGVGPGNFRYWSPRFLADALHHPWGAAHEHNALDAHYAHCEPLHLAAELGIVGLLMVGWMLLRIFRGRGLPKAPFVLMLLYGLTSFPWASTPHALSALFFAGMLLPATPIYRLSQVAAPAQKAAATAAAALAIVLSGFYLWGAIWPGIVARKATAAHLCGQEHAALGAFARVADHPWPQYAAYRDYGYVLLAMRDYEAAAPWLVKALEGLDNGPLHAALGAACQLMGSEERARTHLHAAVYRTPGDADAWARLLSVAPRDAQALVLNRARAWLSAEEFALLRAVAAKPQL